MWRSITASEASLESSIPTPATSNTRMSNPTHEKTAEWPAMFPCDYAERGRAGDITPTRYNAR